MKHFSEKNVALIHSERSAYGKTPQDRSLLGHRSCDRNLALAGSCQQTGDSSRRKDPSIAFSIDKIQHVLRQIGIETREYTGQTYNEGMSLDVLTFDYPAEEKPTNRIVQETVSPAIFFDGTLHKMAQVIVGKADGTVDGEKHD